MGKNVFYVTANKRINEEVIMNFLNRDFKKDTDFLYNHISKCIGKHWRKMGFNEHGRKTLYTLRFWLQDGKRGNNE